MGTEPVTEEVIARMHLINDHDRHTVDQKVCPSAVLRELDRISDSMMTLNGVKNAMPAIQNMAMDVSIISHILKCEVALRMVREGDLSVDTLA